MIVKYIQPAHGDILGIPGDMHFDKQDQGAIDLMLNVFAGVGVNRVCLVGDTFESIGVSRHGRPSREFRLGRGTVMKEAQAAEGTIAALSSIVCSPSQRYVLTGNHEHWWAGLQDDYPGLLDTPWFELYGDLFDGWHIYAEYTALKFGPLLVCHGHRLRGSLSKYSAASVLSNYPGQNTLYGHTHRIDSCTTPTYKYGHPVVHGAWTIGHMKSVEEETKHPFIGPLSERHRQGFALVYFKDVGPKDLLASRQNPKAEKVVSKATRTPGQKDNRDIRFSVELVPIERDGQGKPYCIVQGVLFR